MAPTKTEADSFNALLNAVYQDDVSREIAEGVGAAVDFELWTRTLQAYRGKTIAQIVISEVLDDVIAARDKQIACPRCTA